VDISYTKIFGYIYTSSLLEILQDILIYSANFSANLMQCYVNLLTALS